MNAEAKRYIKLFCVLFLILIVILIIITFCLGFSWKVLLALLIWGASVFPVSKLVSRVFKL
jgi:hypothetical protein